MAKVLSEKLHRHLKRKAEQQAAGTRPAPATSCDPAQMRPSTRGPTPTPAFEGKYASGEALQKYLELRGWDSVAFGKPPPREEDPQLAAVEEHVARRRAAEAEVRRAQVEAGSRDFRNEPAAVVEARAAQIGIVTGGYAAPATFRDPPKPQPVPETGSAGTRARAEAELSNARAVAAQSRTRLDPRRLSSAAFNIYLERIGSGGPWDVDQGSGSAGGG